MLCCPVPRCFHPIPRFCLSPLFLLAIQETILALDKALRMGSTLSLADLLPKKKTPQRLRPGLSRYEVPIEDLPVEIAELLPSCILDDHSGDTSLEVCWEPDNQVWQVATHTWKDPLYQLAYPLIGQRRGRTCKSASTGWSTTTPLRPRDQWRSPAGGETSAKELLGWHTVAPFCSLWAPSLACTTTSIAGAKP